MGSLKSLGLIFCAQWMYVKNVVENRTDRVTFTLFSCYWAKKPYSMVKKSNFIFTQDIKLFLHWTLCVLGLVGPLWPLFHWKYFIYASSTVHANYKWLFRWIVLSFSIGVYNLASNGEQHYELFIHCWQDQLRPTQTRRQRPKADCKNREFGNLSVLSLPQQSTPSSLTFLCDDTLESLGVKLRRC